MVTMDLSALKPEEKVRQNFIEYLKSLGFPEAFFVKEKALSELDLESSMKELPLRRIDLLCYTLHQKTLKPLLLVECKALKLDSTTMMQVMGYNHFIKAPFVALVSKSGYVVFNCLANKWETRLESYDSLCLQARDFYNDS